MKIINPLEFLVILSLAVGIAFGYHDQATAIAMVLLLIEAYHTNEI